jgi:hypothetical protein
MESKTTIDLLDMFAAHALSGYARGGVSYASREEECHEVAVACYDLATAMIQVRQKVLKSIEDKTMRQE